ncbi:MAG: FHA domain-containing protein, partial [Chloroflexota bacterium]|nr:FHA domain-containing protein [Chloroflexota bacterium]
PQPAMDPTSPAARPFQSNATLAYQVPAPPVPAAIIEIAGPGMAPQRVAFRGGTLRVGRGPENDIVLADERVSRRHGSFTTRQGALIYSDGGSTNGSLVNGSLVSEIALGSGDVVRLGNTTLSIHPDR